jgi:hypothetical protein
MHGRRVGLLVVAGVAVGLATSRLIWRRTPPSVRDVVRRTDALTGSRRAPDWRRALVGVALAGATLAVPLYMEPTRPRCTDPCPPRIVVPPTVHLPPLPSIPALPSLPPLPSFPRLPTPVPPTATR